MEVNGWNDVEGTGGDGGREKSFHRVQSSPGNLHSQDQSYIHKT